MKYPKIPNYNHLIHVLEQYGRLQHEYGAKGVNNIHDDVEKVLKTSIKKLKKLSIDKKLSEKEPDDLQKIRKLRPDGPRKMWQSFDRGNYMDKLEGALLARMAGCR